MSIKIKPQGKKVIALPLKTENFVTDKGIEIVAQKLSEAKILEVSDELKDVYSVGDIVLFPTGAGVGIFYKKEHCIFLRNDEIWGIVEEVKIAKRK